MRGASRPGDSEESCRAEGAAQALFDRYSERPGLLPRAPEPDPVTRAVDFWPA
jgi:hypothetical protein